MAEPFRIAAVVTSYAARSHANGIVSNFLRGFPTDDGLIEPRTQIASLYIDQVHSQDVGLQLAHQYNVPVYESIRGALTLGGSSLAVDAVLLIGEHGDYPRSALGQEMLPRRYFFEQICGVIAESGRPIPVYNDKHLSYRWDDAAWMYITAKELDVPLWAASALPLAWRRPVFEHPLGEPLDEAMTIGFHMIERYGFHALEALQCQVERRTGGEVGVRSVQCLRGDEVWRAAYEGRWSWSLAHRAAGAIEDGPGKIDPELFDNSHVFLIEYRDGLAGAVLMLGDNDHVKEHCYAGRRGQHIDALEYYVGAGPAYSVFGYLGLNIEDFFLTRRHPNPVERTYLTTGVLEAAMRSRGAGGSVIETPHLDIAYTISGEPRHRPVGSRPNDAGLKPWSAPEPGATPRAKPIPIDRLGTVRGRQPKLDVSHNWQARAWAVEAPT